MQSLRKRSRRKWGTDMKGYKAFNKDLTCRDFQYEIGKTYEMDKKPIICKKGFHFCQNISDCYEYYEMTDYTRICEVEALGDIVSAKDNSKYCTNKIKIVAEITDVNMKNGNTGKSNSGYRNSGDRNSGDYNSGNRNSGDWNSGYRNSGDWNSGNWNIGNYHAGCFNTKLNPKIKLFDKNSGWTIGDWYNSQAYQIMRTCPYTYSEWVSSNNMNEEEKEKNPSYKTTGGFLKVFKATSEDKKTWWDNLAEEDKQEIRNLPNYDENKFFECVGITNETRIEFYHI